MDVRPAKRQRRRVCLSDDDTDVQIDDGTTQSRLPLRTPVANNTTDVHSNVKSNSKALPLLPSQSKPNSLLSHTSKRSTHSGRTASSSPKKDRKVNQASNSSSTGKSLHNYFQHATDEERWSSKKFEARHLLTLAESVEDDDDRIEDDYDSYDEIFTQHIVNGKLGLNVDSESESNRGNKRHPSPSRRTSHSKRVSSPAKCFVLPPSPVLKNTSQVPQRSRVKYDDGLPWAQRFCPSSLEELAVHKKKVADVRDWLSSVFKRRNMRGLLVLRGPAGCGKTTTVSLLSKSLGFDIVEWKNPSSADPTLGGYMSIGAQFEEFLGRGDKFGGLDLDGMNDTASGKENGDVYSSQRRILLIEEFPTIINRSSSGLAAFRSSLQRYLAAAVPSLSEGSHHGRPGVQASPPIVVIITETLLTSAASISDNFTAHRLLGPDIYNHPGTTIIDFNSIAPTFMYKALQLVMEKEACCSKRTKVPGPAVLERISEIGDIRSAISSLEFLCLKGDETKDWGGSLSSKMKRSSRKKVALTSMEKDSLEMITQREASLGIFHAVGKVVYNKREDASLVPEGTEIPPPPPSHLRQHWRPKVPQVSVNDLVDETGTDIQTFICALHENYAPSCEGQSFTDTIDECIEGLSDSDILCPHRQGIQSPWSAAGVGATYFNAGVDMLRQDEISFQVATRKLLFSLPSPVRRRVPSSGSQGRVRDPYKMFFPASLRLWSESEKIEGLIYLWTKRILDPFLRPILSPSDSNSVYKADSVRSWKSLGVGSLSFMDSEDPVDPRTKAVTMISRDDMLLFQLPYLAKIFPREVGRELEGLTSFRGVEAPSDIVGNGSLDMLENPGINQSSSLPLRARILNEGMVAAHAFGAQLPPSVEDGGKLILSDDDIEDD
ncbi:Cell cycle checkpoint protein rad17 [Monascus purpureus]|uniref:Cell cycle checkpoint protein rad17 n=1 Tax=Monascus purpureus TaxID=5098 RepID=A0A507QN54_MONPU|nr:Cell cycle checkpoint protein rad17 [Monascus purpureus]BDD59119.1 hypothetical protein MAP00_004356 [Monascus purpureus]